MTAIGPGQADVDAVRGLLDLMENFTSNDQRARYLLSSNWMRALAGDRLDRAANEAVQKTKRQPPHITAQ